MTNDIQQEDPSYLSEEDRREERRIEKLKVPKFKPKRNFTQTPRRSPLEIAQILAWADAHHERTGQWPNVDSGLVVEAPGERWSTLEAALIYGRRGLPSGLSLPRLLAQYRGVRNRKGLPPYTEEVILSWADAHYNRTGKWPNAHSGPILDAPGETWMAVQVALTNGQRGLPGGKSLPILLAQTHNLRLRSKLPQLHVDSILAWADAHHERTGKWPTPESGEIVDAPGETWMAVQCALTVGSRGLQGSSSLPQLLLQQRGINREARQTPLTEAQILAWADAHYERTNKWPLVTSGRIAECPELNWDLVHYALLQGRRGLPGGRGLPTLLVEERNARLHLALPPLTVEVILSWADSHFERTGRWPSKYTGPIIDVPGETWNGIQLAMLRGRRGLPVGKTLPMLLSEHRGLRYRGALPRYTESQIIAWADAYFAREGRWPNHKSGSIPESPGDTWTSVQHALDRGQRGLSGGSSIARLLAVHREVRNEKALPKLTEAQILQWADEHYGRTGKWPLRKDGAIIGTEYEKWSNVNSALVQGVRGLPGGSSLTRLLAKHRNVPNRKALPPYTEPLILSWADAFYARQGHWPRVLSGSIAEAPNETWIKVHDALERGTRGLPGGSSLLKFLQQHGRNLEMQVSAGRPTMVPTPYLPPG